MDALSHVAASAYRYLAQNHAVPVDAPPSRGAFKMVLDKARATENFPYRGEALNAVRSGLNGAADFEAFRASIAKDGGRPGEAFLAAVTPETPDPAATGARTAMESTKPARPVLALPKPAPRDFELHDGVTQGVRRNEVLKELPKPSAVKAGLNDYVWGQDSAKTVVSMGLYNHLKRIAVIDDCKARGQEIPDKLRKGNAILLVGRTGTGKTLIAQTLAKVANVPFYALDATQVTKSGYIGGKLEQIITGLLQQADGDIAKAQRGIVYIDEIDKKRINKSARNDDPGAEGVQDGLLKFIEGTVIEIPNPKYDPQKPFSNEPKTIHFDTSGVLFMAGGAFSGIDQVPSQATEAAKADEPSRYGFGATLKNPKAPEAKLDYAKLTVDQFIGFGMKPELMGRFPTIAALDDLTADDLKRICTEPKDALLKQYQFSFNLEGVDFQVGDDALETIAAQALARGTGARALRSIFASAFDQLEYEIVEASDVRKVVIDKDLKPTFVKDTDGH